MAAAVRRLRAGATGTSAYFSSPQPRAAVPFIFEFYIMKTRRIASSLFTATGRRKKTVSRARWAANRAATIAARTTAATTRGGRRTRTRRRAPAAAGCTAPWAPWPSRPRRRRTRCCSTQSRRVTRAAVFTCLASGGCHVSRWGGAPVKKQCGIYPAGREGAPQGRRRAPPHAAAGSRPGA